MADRDGQPAGEPTAASLPSGSARALPQLSAALESGTNAVRGSLTGRSIENEDNLALALAHDIWPMAEVMALDDAPKAYERGSSPGVLVAQEVGFTRSDPHRSTSSHTASPPHDGPFTRTEGTTK